MVVISYVIEEGRMPDVGITVVRVSDRWCGCHEVSKKEMGEGWL